jgi:hypothetical protein
MIGALTTANADFYYKCGLFFDDSGVTAVVLGSTDPNMADGNYWTWMRVVESVNQNITSLVDYKISAIPAFATGDAAKTTQYSDINSVIVKKVMDTGSTDPIDDQYVIEFHMGTFSSMSYIIPAATLNEAVDLLNKTPLASKVKDQ